MCNAAVIGNSESKLDNSIFDFGIEVDDYNNLYFDINRNAGWVEIALWEMIYVSPKEVMSHMTVKLFLQEYFCFQPSLWQMAYNLSTTRSNKPFIKNKSTFLYQHSRYHQQRNLLHDFNINLHLSNKYVFDQCLTPVSTIIPYDILK